MIYYFEKFDSVHGPKPSFFCSDEEAVARAKKLGYDLVYYETAPGQMKTVYDKATDLNPETK